MRLFKTPRQSFAARLTFAFVLCFSGVVLVSAFFALRSLEQKTLDELKNFLEARNSLLTEILQSSLIKDPGWPHVQEQVRKLGAKLNSRISVIGTDGRVLADSYQTQEELELMDNQLYRPEVAAALKGQRGVSLRMSPTLGAKMLYVAVPFYQEGRLTAVVRNAFPFSYVNDVLDTVRRPVIVDTAIGLAALLIIAFFLERSMGRSIARLTAAARRFSKGHFDSRIRMEGDDDLKILGDAMNQMALSLSERIEELETEKAKFTAILQSMSEGVIAVDQNKTILLVNPSAEAILQLRQEEMVGKSLIEALRNTAMDDVLTQALEGSTRISREIEFLEPEEKIVRVNAVGIRKEGSGVCAILVLHDITEIRKLERVRREFVANVSHELKTPLTSLKGFLETLLNGAMEEQESARRFLKMMEEDTNRLTRLIDELLELARLESRREPLQLQPIDLVREIETIMESLRPRMAEKKIRYQFVYGDQDHFKIAADRDKIRQVLLNLLDNAIKFNREGGTIRIRLEAVGLQIKVSIKDTGIGIPEESLGRIFERFYRVERGRSRDMGGTGLGLSIVKHIVEAHGGQVGYKSELEKGSEFFFTLPFVLPSLRQPFSPPVT